MSDLYSLLDGLSRRELQDLISEANRRLSDMRPVHIKQMYKRCGKASCWCAHADKTDGHGPYLYAVYTERGQQHQKSLGVRFTPEQIEDYRSRRRPRWLDFVLTGKALERAKAGPNKWDFQQRELNSIEFEQFFGLPMEEDNLSRPRSLTFNYVEYDKALVEFDQQQEMVYSSFASWGVCTRKGYSTLKSLTERGFYLVS